MQYQNCPLEKIGGISSRFYYDLNFRGIAAYSDENLSQIVLCQKNINEFITKIVFNWLGWESWLYKMRPYTLKFIKRFFAVFESIN